MDEKGCKCCDKVAAIQIVRHDRRYVGRGLFGNLFSGPYNLLTGDYSWNFDEAPYMAYVYTSGDDMIDPTEGDFLWHRDSPGAGIRYLGMVLEEMIMEFETCVVCFSGKEGYTESPSPSYVEPHLSPYDDLHIVWNSEKPGKGLTVYGCVKWGHRFVARPGVVPRHGEDYNVYRYIEGVWEYSGRNKPRRHEGSHDSEFYDMPYISGGPPSQTFADLF